MSASSRSGMRAKDEHGAGGFAGAFWLARWEIGSAWPSYALGGLILLFFGFLVVPGLSGVFEFEGLGQGSTRMEDFYNDFLADAFFLGVCAFLAVNALVHRDAFSSKLLFLRELPISAGSVVAGRAILMLFALLVNAPAFFLPAFFLTDFGDLGASYLGFAGVWIGYGLLASGLYLLLEFTTNGGSYAPTSIGTVLALLVVLALLEWTADLGLVGRTVELVRVYGALPAVFSVLAGVVAFALLTHATVRRIQRREVFSEPFA
ncbi:MAG: hypothetical protein H0V21_05775 [Rubrobacter sp.]|nr:hypothetical protein [Rubrobacter sp.]